MKINPCGECIIKVNCTAICTDKTDFKKQIIETLLNYKSGRGSRKRHNLLMKMLRKTNKDEGDIIHR